jgi:hypothetical protein
VVVKRYGVDLDANYDVVLVVADVLRYPKENANDTRVCVRLVLVQDMAEDSMLEEYSSHRIAAV